MKTKAIFATILISVAALALIMFGSTNISAGPGDLDPTFGNGGQIPPPRGLPTLSGAFDVAVQLDGRILVGGFEQNFSGGSPNGRVGLLLTRYLQNGLPDPTFGQGGKVLAHLSATCHSYGDDLLLQTDGKIVVTTHLDGCGPETGAYILRYLQDGNLDSTFDQDGKLRILGGFAGFNTTTCRSASQSNGKLVLSCGEWMWEEDYWKVIIRLNPDGSIDGAFGGGAGRVYLDANDFFPFDIAIQPDDKIVVASEVNLNGGRSVVVGRLNSDGSPDFSFGTSGWIYTSNGQFDLDSRAIAIQPDNKIVVVGSYQAPPNTVGGHAIRYLPNGSLDTTFGASGMTFSSPGRYYSGVVVQSNGKIVVGDTDYRVTRFLRSGTLDPNFGIDGQMLVSFPNPMTGDHNGSGGITSIAIQRDGRLITAGFWQAHDPWPDVNLLFRYQAIARLVGDSKASSDFDSDGRSDLSVFRPSDGTWYLNRSTAGFSANQFGLASDKITPADYDGDGQTDIAVFREGVWYWVDSTSSSFRTTQFGLAGDVPVAADYTGDGRAELAIYRGGTWWALDLTNNQTSTVQFGFPADRPVVGDFDGDGRTDQSIYRNGEWHLNRSSLGYTVVNFGLATDKLVPADYDGDGKTDPAVYRDGTWYLLRSLLGFTAFQFGLPTDVPTPADYDGDGRTDAAVYRNGTWYITQSSTGTPVYQQFGLSSDIPIAGANQ